MELLQQQLEFWLVGVTSSQHFAGQRPECGEIRSQRRSEERAAKPTDDRSQQEWHQKRNLIPLFIHDDLAL